MTRRKYPTRQTIRSLRVKPGDMVVFELAEPVTVDIYRFIKKQLNGLLPKGVKALLLDEGIKCKGVIRGWQ